MNLQEITQKIGELRSWSLGNGSIMKDFEFPDFKKTMEFVNKVADIAEKHSHHPDIIISYSKVKLTLTTHSVKGLTDKDFKVAKDIDLIS